MPRFRLLAALAAVLAFASPAHAQDDLAGAKTHHVQMIQISMSSYAFAPNRLDLVAGSPYLLHFVNTAQKAHNFDAPELFAASQVAPEDRAKVSEGAVEVEGGASVDIAFTPTKRGTYKFDCSHFLHASFGMTGTAVVE